MWPQRGKRLKDQCKTFIHSLSHKPCSWSVMLMCHVPIARWSLECYSDLYISGTDSASNSEAIIQKRSKRKVIWSAKSWQCLIVIFKTSVNSLVQIMCWKHLIWCSVFWPFSSPSCINNGQCIWQQKLADWKTEKTSLNTKYLCILHKVELFLNLFALIIDFKIALSLIFFTTPHSNKDWKHTGQQFRIDSIMDVNRKKTKNKHHERL